MHNGTKTTRSHSFEYMLAGLLTLLLLAPLLREAKVDASPTFLAITFGLAVAAGIRTFALSTRTRLIGIGCGLLLAALGWYGSHYELQEVRVVVVVGVMALGIWAIILTLRETLLGPRVDLNRVMGAVCGYLLMGLLWSLAYLLIALADPDNFTGLQGSEYDDLFPQTTYFSFVTLTTLGYGDILPKGEFARSLVYLEAIVGQMYVAILIAGLVSAYVPSRRDNKDSSNGD